MSAGNSNSNRNPPAQNQNPQRADWRKKKAAPGERPVGTPGRGGQKSWEQSAANSSFQEPFWHKVKMAVWGVLFLLLSATLIFTWLFWPKETPFLASAVLHPTDASLPPLAYTPEDIEQLSTTNPTNLAFTNLDPSKQSRESFLLSLRNELDRVIPGGPGTGLFPGRIVFIYLSIHGVVNEENKPCLLFSDADATDSSTWMPLEKLFSEICEHENLKKRKAKVVIFLDANRITADWRMGLFYNNFVERMRSLVAEYTPRLIVFNAASTGEKAWSAPELGGSVFAHFLSQGIQGEADKVGDNNRKITCGELADYVQAKVADWTLQHRGVRQSPEVMPAKFDRSLPLAYSGSPVVTKKENDHLDQIKQELKKAQALWARLERSKNNTHESALLQPTASERHPLLKAEIEHALLRWEANILAGPSFHGEASQGKEEEIGKLLTELESDYFSIPLATLSLPMYQLAKSSASRGPSAAGLFTKWKKAREKMPPEPLPKLDHLSREELAAEAWQQMLDPANPPKFDQLDLAAEFMQGSSSKMPLDFLETHFLSMLRVYLDRVPRVEEAFPLSIQARHAAEIAAQPADERVHYPLWSEMNKLDQQRRLAEDELFVGSNDLLNHAEKVLLDVKQDYKNVLDKSETLASAIRWRDECLAELPYLSRWLLDKHLRKINSLGTIPTLAELHQYIADLQQFSQAIETATFEADKLPELRDREQTLRKSQEKIRGLFAQQVKLLTQDVSAGVSPVEALACLETPLLNGQDRSLLYEKLLDDWQKKISSAKSGGELAEKSSSPIDTAYLQNLCSLDSHPALHLAGVKPLDQNKTKIEERDSCLLLLHQQGAALRLALNKVKAECDSLLTNAEKSMSIVPALQPREIRTHVYQADTRARSVAGLWGERLWKNEIDAPHGFLRKLDTHYLSLWQAKRAMDDYWGPGPEEGEAYFSRAATEYLQNASRLGFRLPQLQLGNEDLKTLRDNRVLAAKAFPEITPEKELFFTLGQDQLTLKLAFQFPVDQASGTSALLIHSAKSWQDLITTKDVSGKVIRRHAITNGKGTKQSWEPLVARDQFQLEASNIQAELFFRGHVSSKSLPIKREQIGDELVVHPRKQIEPPTIQVVSDSKPLTSLMFILDCSGSMKKSMQSIDKVGVMVGNKSRWKVATETLNETLDEFATKQKLRMGLLTYGKTFDEKYKRINPDYVSGKLIVKPPSTYRDLVNLCNEDVTEEVPFGEVLNGVLCGDIKEKLGQIKEPTGETNLSFALIQALKKINNSPLKSEANAIVLITDGIEEIFGEQIDNAEQSALAKATKESTRKELLAMLSKAPHNSVPIYIIGIDFEQVEKNNRAEVENLRAIAESSGGGLTAVSNSKSLEQTLRSLVPASKFVVMREDTELLSETTPVELNKTWSPKGRFQPGNYVLKVLAPAVKSNAKEPHEEMKFSLAGEEALRFKYNSRERRLEFDQYQGLNPRKGEQLLNDLHDPKHKFLVVPYLPARHGNDVTFIFSLQSRHAELEQWNVTSRPKSFWAEVRASTSEEPYYFFEPNYLPQTPVPVLQLDANKWPLEASTAFVSLWFHPAKKVNPDLIIPVEQDSTNRDWEGTQIHIERKLAASAKRNLEFIVTETSPAEGPMVPLCIEMSITPDEIRRYVNLQTRKRRTTFSYSNSEIFREQNQKTEVKITSKTSLISGAVKLTQPISVTISDR